MSEYVNNMALLVIVALIFTGFPLILTMFHFPWILLNAGVPVSRGFVALLFATTAGETE